LPSFLKNKADMWSRLWPRFGFNLAEKLWSCDENMVKIRSRFLDVLQKWSRFGRNLVEIWYRFGLDLVEKWSRICLNLVDKWSIFGKDLVQIGPMVEN
jgi:hypothetical protein